MTSFTPGPNNIMAMLIANKYGIQKTIKFCLGVAVGVFVIILIGSYFNIVLEHFIPKIKFTMKILGTVYMLYLAIKILMGKPNKDDNSAISSSFFTGVLLQLINPKGLLYCLTVVSTFILPYYSSHVVLVGFSLFLALVGFSSTICWS
ncbi:LysE family translocator, partial [Proteus mirabilis]|uniref:LysE family translocator n=1 Tax=Proteus mirabilis TaxID=584 RepID=UPI0034D185FA